MKLFALKGKERKMGERKMALLFIFFSLIFFSAFAARADLQDQFDATCRITAGNSAGSGCVYQLGSDYALVLTAAHVVQGQQVCSCEFWRAGHQSAKIPAQVLVADPTIDAASVVVPLAALGGVSPKSIPLGTAGDVPGPGATIQSVGCASGAWATAWQGHVTRVEDGRVYFVPAPAGGRSGSVLTDATGSKIVGLLQIRTGDGEGGATSVATLRARMDGRQTKAISGFKPDPVLTAYLAQCPGGSCGPDGCDPSGLLGRNGGRAILPWNAKPKQAPQQPGGNSGNPWPTLPQQPTPAPRVDLDPIVQQLERIENRIPVPAPPSPIPAAPIVQADPRVDQALQGVQQAAGLAQQAHQRIDGLAGEVKATGEAVQKVGEAVGPLVKLRAKLEADAEEGGIKGKLAQRILDAGNGDDSLRKVLITAGIVLGLVLLIGIAVIHTMRTGKGPAHAIIEKLAERHPDNERLAALHAKLESLDAKIAGAGHQAATAAGTALGGAIGGPVGALAGGALPDVAQRLRDMEARLHDLALNAPPPGAGSAQSPLTAPAVAPTTINVAAPQPSAPA